MYRPVKFPLFMHESAKKIDALKADRAALEDLISGRKHFMAKVEKWITSEMKKTGRTRKEVLEESVRLYKKDQRLNLVKRAKKDFVRLSSDLAGNIRARHAKRRQ